MTGQCGRSETRVDREAATNAPGSRKVQADLLGLIAVAALILWASVGSAETIPAELTSSRYSADLLLYPSQCFRAPKAYIGPCPGYHRGERLKILITDNRYGGSVQEVRLTERHEAEILFCTRR